MQSKYVFMSGDENTGKVKLYFDVEGEGLAEISWANADYIAGKLKEFGAKDLEELNEVLTKDPEQEVYEYEFTKEGKKYEGWSLDEPFPKPSKPELTIVSGKVKEVRNNGIKVAFIIADKKTKKDFVITRSIAVYDEHAKKYHYMKSKEDNLLRALVVEDFSDLVGTEITFTRQAAGSNYYYDPA